MAAPARTPLRPSTVAREWWMDINTTPAGAPTWLPVNGIVEFKPPSEGNFEDDSDFDGEGHESTLKTSQKWGVEAKLRLGPTAADPTEYDPSHEFLRAAHEEMGAANTIAIRFYEMTPDGPRIRAYAGNVGVNWEDEGGDTKKPSRATLKLNGQGKRNIIAHPDL